MACRFILAALMTVGAVNADGIYTKNSPVLQVSAKTYDSLIARSNHTSIVEFYAPWCGHCQSLKPAYEKAAKNLAGLAKVAAVNCDEDANKAFCGTMGVQGFPTLKIVKPGSKPGRPVVEDYQGQRSAKAIVEAVVDKIPNHVKRVQDSGLDAWLSDSASQAKAILFTDKGTTGAVIKALAVDFLGSIEFAQIRNKEKAAAAKFDITKFPTIVLIPSKDAEPISYNGEMRKDALIEFFSQVASPNPDPAPRKAKATTATKRKGADAKASSKFAKASDAHKSSDFDDHMQAKGTVILSDEIPVESPLPIVEHDEKPMVVKDAIPEAAPAIPQLATADELESACLDSKSGTCILLLLPPHGEGMEDINGPSKQAVSSFSEVADKHKKRSASIFPFYTVPASNEASITLRKSLNLGKDSDLQIIAINRKRKWWRSYPITDYGLTAVEDFVDSIKLGEGAKKKLPVEFFSTTEASPPMAEPEAEPTVITETQPSIAADPEPVAEPSTHDEL